MTDVIRQMEQHDAQRDARQGGRQELHGETAQMATLPTLREVRLQHAYSAKELAQRAGVQTATVTHIERWLSVPHMATMRKLAAALDCAPQAIAWPGDPFHISG